MKPVENITAPELLIGKKRSIRASQTCILEGHTSSYHQDPKRAEVQKAV